MPLYKPGDRVLVRDDLVPGKKYYMYEDKYQYNYFVEEMDRHRGKVVQISRISIGQYHIKEECDGCFWVDEMFAGLEEDCLANEELDLELPEFLGLLEVDHA